MPKIRKLIFIITAQFLVASANPAQSHANGVAASFYVTCFGGSVYLIRIVMIRDLE